MESEIKELQYSKILRQKMYNVHFVTSNLLTFRFRALGH